MDEQIHPRREPRYPGTLNEENLRRIFHGAADFNARMATAGENGPLLPVFFMDGLVSSDEIATVVLKPLHEALRPGPGEDMLHQALNGAIYNAVAVPVDSLDTAASKLVNGFCLVLFPGTGKAVAYEVKTGEKRSIGKPEVETAVKGSKDAFTETVRTNTSLLRRHLRSPDLRLHESIVGRQTLTNVSVAWLDNVADPTLAGDICRRFDEIDVDGFLTPAAVEEYLTGGRKTAFPLLLYTERADKFAQGLLEGRVGVLVDGLPLGYLAPTSFSRLMASQEDLGTDYVSASCLRVLRYFALGLSLLLPGLYVAAASFHQEMIPTPLLLAIIDSKRSVPFPTAVEVLILLAAFELLQESGLHLPQSVGQSVSIIGGLVVGTAAVQAKLVSPAALIVTAAAGICGFALPGRELADAVRVWRFGLCVCAAAAGLFGLTAGYLALLIHLSGLSCCGRPYLAPFSDASTGGRLSRPLLKKRKYRERSLRPINHRKQR